MSIKSLIDHIKQKQSYLCVGLDTDDQKIPLHLRSQKDAVLAFNKAVIDATLDHCVSYKINTAFYESMGIRGWEIMQETLEHIPDTHFVIADAKRGDIGNTSAQYAKTFFEAYGFDAVTVAPYMGEDSIRPFLEYTDKVTIVLGLTSNKGAEDFELQRLQSGEFVYERVLKTVSGWGTPQNLMFVVGATQAKELANIRRIVPDHFLLVPGIGAQGGSLQEVAAYGSNKDIGLLVNASRAVIYASQAEDFSQAAAKAARSYHDEMRALMRS